MLIGKVSSGKITLGDKLHTIDQEGKSTDQGKIMKIIKKQGMGEVELDHAFAGDIVSISGLTKAMVTNTLTSMGEFTPIKSIPINPPMLQMTLTYNDSPF